MRLPPKEIVFSRPAYLAPTVVVTVGVVPGCGLGLPPAAGFGPNLLK